MESIGQQERRALTAANIPETLRSLIGFAAKSAAALRQESSSLAKLRNPNPFFAILSSLLSNVEERLENATSLSEERVLKLLATLERLAKWPTSFKAPGRPSNENAYPRLTLTIDNRPQLARRCIKALSESAIAINDRKKFERAFKAFANVKPAPRGPELSELTRTTTEPKPNSNNTAAQCLQRLYKTLCQICRCSVAVNEDSFMANVMADYEARSAVADSITIQSFFLHRHHIENNETNETNEWKETRIRVLAKRYDVETSCDIQDSQRVLDFCKHLRSQELCCLKLRASGHALFHDGIELPTHRISLRTPSVSLANVLTSVILNKDSQRKLHLSFLLAKAVWQFYDSDWIAEAWSKHEVQFMRQCVEGLQDKVLLNHRPFISARFRDDVTQGTPLIQEQAALANTPRQSHIFPKILALGITLLEIELGEGIESRYRSDFLDRDGRPRANAAHVTAGEFITSDNWKRNTKTFLPVKQAIEACVKPDTSLLGVDPTCVRENLHRHVVEPLGKLFGIAYECGGRPEEFDPGPMDFGPSQDTYDNFPPTPDSTEMQKEGGSPKVAVVEADVYEIIGSENREASSFARELHVGDNIIGGHASLNCQQITSRDSHEPTCLGTQLRSVILTVGRLFHSETIESHQDIIHAKEFFKDLKHFRRTLFEDQNYMKVNPPKRVRIAILDTGFDEEHLEVQGLLANKRLALCRSWVDNSEQWMDNDPERHGTHCAYLLHEAAPEADIYVAKVFNENTFRSSQAKQIAAAIRYAVTEWEVDIISMSFGLERPSSETTMPEYKTIVMDIENAIQEAATKLIFVAASNGGKGYSRTFPATDSNVICIHASNGKGRDADINPKGQPGDGFMTLGIAIPFLQDGKYIYMSGTSFATPIAAGLAANILHFANGCKTLLDDATKHRLRKKGGMLKMFRLMSTEVSGDYQFVAPWNLWERNWKADKHVNNLIWSSINTTL